jgi:hypothetical protein
VERLIEIIAARDTENNCVPQTMRAQFVIAGAGTARLNTKNNERKQQIARWLKALVEVDLRQECGMPSRDRL